MVVSGSIALGAAALRSKTGRRITERLRRKAEREATKIIEREGTKLVSKAKAKIAGKKGRW